MMSPYYHPTMRIGTPIRMKLHVNSIFNYLGPFLNPVWVSFCYYWSIQVRYISLWHEKKLIVYSEGLDEMSPLGKILFFLY